MKGANWIIALCGLWEAGDIVAPFVPGFGEVPAYMWNHIVVGVVLLVAGLCAALTRNAGLARAMDWLAVLAGFWLIVGAVVLRAPTGVGLWNDVIVGVVVLVLGVWAALSASRVPG